MKFRIPYKKFGNFLTTQVSATFSRTVLEIVNLKHC